MRRAYVVPLFLSSLFTGACSSDAHGVASTAAFDNGADEVHPKIAVARPNTGEPSSGEGIGVAASAIQTGNGISYNGGPVMSGTVNVYYIWYGNWANDSSTSILTDLADNLGSSPYYDINELYDDASGGRVTGSVRLAGSTTDNYSQGSSFSNGWQSTWAVVNAALAGGRLPVDPNGVYFVLTSPDVTEGGFCTSHCGWHTYSSYGGTSIKFAFIGNAATQCPGSCTAGQSPNGNLGADGMASVVAHELEETATDPLINAWEDNGYENADRCAWNFGSASYTAANGATANMRLGGRDYYIQQNWLNQGGGSCGLSQTVAAYTFDDGSGGTARDDSGAGHTGTLANGAGWTSGIAGSAVSLNGSSAFVDTGAHLLDTSQSYTISTWVKLNSLGGWQTMVSQEGIVVTPFFLQKRGDSNAFSFNVHDYETLDQAAWADATFTPKTGVWYNVVGVYDQPNGQIKLYVNGVLQSTASFTGGWNAGGHTMIGRGQYNGSPVDFVNGAIDDTSVYSRVLSDAEVQQFYQNRAGVLLQRSSCADVRSQIPSATDGDAVIDVEGNLVTVYCAGMQSSPKEYLSLLNTSGGANSSYYGQGGNSSGLTTSYTKVRFHPSNLTVDTSDTAFSQSSGWKSFGTSYFYSNNYGDAADCLGGWSQTGRGNIDLTGTAFAALPNQFSPQGYLPAGTATYSANNQVVNLTGGGDCGGMDPTSGQPSVALEWAQGIVFETRQYLGNPAPTSTAQALSIWSSLPNPTPGYGAVYPTSLASYSNQTLVPGGSNSNVGYHIKVGVNVSSSQVGSWSFRAGADFGYGGTLLVDGVELESRWSDMWWAGGFGNASQYLTGNVTLSQGFHTLEIYGFENCCDGTGTVQFSAPDSGGAWAPIALGSTFE